MVLLQALGYISFGLGVLLVIAGVSTEDFVFFNGAISLLISGVLFLAIDKIVTTLVEIRDAVRGDIENKSQAVGVTTKSAEEDSFAEPTKTLAELSADLEKMKKRL